jgi:hypothetical protein
MAAGTQGIGKRSWDFYKNKDDSLRVMGYIKGYVGFLFDMTHNIGAVPMWVSHQSVS